MSSERQVRILSTENPRFPEEGSSAQGKSGPKPRTNVVGDGQLVEIPVPSLIRLNEAVTQEALGSGVMDNSVQVLRLGSSEVHFSKG